MREWFEKCHWTFWFIFCPDSRSPQVFIVTVLNPCWLQLLSEHFQSYLSSLRGVWHLKYRWLEGYYFRIQISKDKVLNPSHICPPFFQFPCPAHLPLWPHLIFMVQYVEYCIVQDKIVFCLFPVLFLYSVRVFVYTFLSTCRIVHVFPRRSLCRYKYLS